MLKLTIFISAFILFSCGEKAAENSPGTLSDSTIVDTVAILNDPKNNLNVQTNSFSEIDSSGIIMFPLSMGESSRGGSSYSYKEIPYNSFWNIIFYNSHTSEYHLLSNKKILINSFDLKYGGEEDTDISIAKRAIFYQVTIDDYNQDKKLNSDDPEYLFVSDREGKNFRQISPKGYNLKSWAFMKSTNRIIMALTKDSDNNKKFGDSDEVLSFQIEIDKESQATEIFSAEFKKNLKVIFDKDWKRIK